MNSISYNHTEKKEELKYETLTMMGNPLNSYRQNMKIIENINKLLPRTVPFKNLDDAKYHFLEVFFPELKDSWLSNQRYQSRSMHRASKRIEKLSTLHDLYNYEGKNLGDLLQGANYLSKEILGIKFL